MFNKILGFSAICWFLYTLTQIHIGSQPEDAKNDYTFLIVGAIIALIALIKWWIPHRIEHHRRYVEMMENGGPRPEWLYATNVRTYYGMATQGIFHGYVEVPTPFSTGYYWRGRYHNEIWDQPGYWQDEWTAYCLGNPSVYDGSKPLPFPYTGPAGKCIPARPYHEASDVRIRMWRDKLLFNNTVAL